MTTDAIVILAFLVIDFSLVGLGLYHLQDRRIQADITDIRRRNRLRR